ncbi:hypothetical protein ABZP36_003513 [Zizania latifolia]
MQALNQQLEEAETAIYETHGLRRPDHNRHATEARRGENEGYGKDRHRVRPVAWASSAEVVAELEWAVTLCEESLVRSGTQHSSRHGGSDLSRLESEDPSPFHTREFALGSGRLGHGRSNSAM